MSTDQSTTNSATRALDCLNGDEYDRITTICEKVHNVGATGFAEESPAEMLQLLREERLLVTPAPAWTSERRDYNASEAPRTQWSFEGDAEPFVELQDDGVLHVFSDAANGHVMIALPQDLVRDVAQTALDLEPDQEEIFANTTSRAPYVLGIATDAAKIAPELDGAITAILRGLGTEQLLELSSDGGYLGRAAQDVYRADRLKP